MSYRFDSFVNPKEADVLKDMIFKRIRERSESASEEVQSDVMDMARSSFVSDNNPFSKIVNKPSETEVTKNEPVASKTEKQEIGFPQKEGVARVAAQSKLINEQIASATVTTTMQEASSGLQSRTSFMGALNFLNSQAAVSLIRTRADKFEVVV